jgi:hypothetical protein
LWGCYHAGLFFSLTLKYGQADVVPLSVSREHNKRSNHNKRIKDTLTKKRPIHRLVIQCHHDLISIGQTESVAWLMLSGGAKLTTLEDIRGEAGWPWGQSFTPL